MRWISRALSKLSPCRKGPPSHPLRKPRGPACAILLAYTPLWNAGDRDPATDPPARRLAFSISSRQTTSQRRSWQLSPLRNLGGARRTVLLLRRRREHRVSDDHC